METLKRTGTIRLSLAGLSTLVGLLILDLPAYAGENVIRNGSFEAADPGDAGRPLDWKLQGDGKYLDGGHTGKCVMVKGSWSLYEQTIPLRANAAYKVSCWIKGTVPGDLGQIVFSTVREVNKTWKDWDLYIRVTGEWTRFERLIRTPVNCPAETKLTLLSEGRKGEIYFDDVAIETSTALPPEQNLVASIEGPARWRHAILTCDKAQELAQVPSRCGMFITQEATNLLRPYVLLQDNEGEVFSFMFLSGLGRVASQGEYREEPITGFQLESIQGAPKGNGKLDAPVRLYGLKLVCLGMLNPVDIMIGRITLDGAVVDDFSTDNGWKVASMSDGVNAASRRTPEPLSAVLPQPPSPETRPSTLGNLVSNGSFENLGDEKPEAWTCGAEAVPTDENGNPLVDPAKHNALYKVEDIGIETTHAVSIKVTDKNAWGAWQTGISGVRPNTIYTVSLWYRQPTVGAICVDLFGKRYRLSRVLSAKPDHWLRWSEHVNSGSFSGDVNVGFHVESPGKPTKVVIDEFEIFEGSCPVGHNRARFGHDYYRFEYISPDMIAPVGMSMEFHFLPGDKPETMDWVLEIPKDVTCEGYNLYLWGHPETHSMRIEAITRDGVPYTRCVFTMENFRPSYFVPLPKRDSWAGCLGDYSSRKHFTCYLSTKLTEGTRKAYYYARWPAAGSNPAGRQPERELLLNVTRIPAVPQVKPPMLAIWQLGNNAEHYPGIVEAVKHIGCNGVNSLGGGSPDDVGSRAKAFREAGIDNISIWMNFPTPMISWRRPEKLEPDGWGMGLDGQRHRGQTHGGSAGRTPGYCFSYRGAGWKEGMDRLRSYVDQGYNQFYFDDAPSSTCFCPECKAEFKEYLETVYELPYQDPAAFMATATPPPEYEQAWNDFRAWVYGRTAGAMKRELAAYAKDKGLPYKILFAQSAWPVQPKKRETLAVFKEVFDYAAPQLYLYTYWGYSGSPKLIGNGAARIQENEQGYQRLLAPDLGPGLGYMHPACSLDPHAQMLYQILEVAMAPRGAGYVMYAPSDIDLGDLKYMAEANALLGRFSDVFLEGEVLPQDKTLLVDPEFQTVRIKTLGDEVLMFVADYSTYEPVERTIDVLIDDLDIQELTDAVTGEVIKRTTKEHTFFSIPVKEVRARLFYSGPRKR